MYSVFTLRLEVLQLFESKIMHWYAVKISLIVLSVLKEYNLATKLLKLFFSLFKQNVTLEAILQVCYI